MHIELGYCNLFSSKEIRLNPRCVIQGKYFDILTNHTACLVSANINNPVHKVDSCIVFSGKLTYRSRWNPDR